MPTNSLLNLPKMENSKLFSISVQDFYCPKRFRSLTFFAIVVFLTRVILGKLLIIGDLAKKFFGFAYNKIGLYQL